MCRPPPHPLLQAKGELPNMRAALERHRSGAYSSLMVGEAHTQLQQIEEYRAKRREEWNTEFAKHLEVGGAAGRGRWCLGGSRWWFYGWVRVIHRSGHCVCAGSGRAACSPVLLVLLHYASIWSCPEIHVLRLKCWHAAPAVLQAAERNGGNNYLADLPEHCIKETAGQKIMVVLGFASVLLQLVASYTSLSLSFRLPIKGE